MGKYIHYLLLIAAVFAASGQSILIKVFNNRYMRGNSCYYIFNIICYSIAALVSITALGPQPVIRFQTIFFGILYAILFLATMLLFRKAIETGPISITSMLLSYSILLAVLYSIIFLREQFLPNHLFGLAAFSICIFLTCLNKRDKKYKHNWFIICVVMMITNAGATIITKQHQAIMQGEQVNEYLVVIYIAVTVFNLILFLFRRKKDTGQVFFKQNNLGFIALAVVTGIVIRFGSFFTTDLMSKMPAAVLLPSISGGSIVLTAVAGRILFKEKLTSKEQLGFSIGIIGLILLNV